jgi:hypothetical protein
MNKRWIPTSQNPELVPVNLSATAEKMNAQPRGNSTMTGTTTVPLDRFTTEEILAEIQRRTGSTAEQILAEVQRRIAG